MADVGHKLWLTSVISYMKKLYSIAEWVAAHMTWIVVAATALALLLPQTFLWMETSVITPLLGIVMFGMGLTLKPSDFLPLIRRPKDIIIGELAQFVIMPLAAWLLCFLLQLPPELALGVILVGCCPGGTASNVMCFLAKGDVALSVGMTAVSTLLAPLTTPALVFLLAGESVDVNVVAMFMSIVQVVILPILAGFAVSHWLGTHTKKVEPLLPMISTLAVVAIIGIVVSRNAARILDCSMMVAVAVICHNLLGLLLGYILAKVIGLEPAKRSAIAIEVGMQNSGLATSLASTHFAMYPLATVPGALFSVWHNFSGSIAASLFRKMSHRSVKDS